MSNLFDKINDFEDIILKYIDSKYDDGKNIKALCPFHQEKEPSFGINKSTGVYQCFSCGVTGNIITFVQHMEKFATKLESVKFILNYYHIEDEKTFVKPKPVIKKEASAIDQSVVDGYAKNLTGSMLQRLKDEWKITDENIKTFQLGCDGDRITIPIYDGPCMNIRKYSFTDKKMKVISYGAGYGEARLFPLASLEQEEIWFCEGEKDAINAICHGLNAVTNTCGANTFKEEWIELFRDKIVNIVYDNDKAGKGGAENIINMILPVVKSIRNINLNVDKDITDYFNKYGKTVAELITLRNATPDLKQQLPPDCIDMTNPPKIHLSLANETYFNKAFNSDCLVVSNTNDCYFIPKKVEVTCGGNRENCTHCKMGATHSSILDYYPSQPKILKFIDASDTQSSGHIKKDSGVPATCRVNIKVLEPYTVHRILVGPKIDLADLTGKEPEYIESFMFGQRPHSNRTYNVMGYTTSEPTKGKMVHVFTHSTSDYGDLNKELTPEDVESLKIFQAPANPDDIFDTKSIRAKIDDIIENEVNNVTKIYERDYVHEGVDLVFHSPLKLYFNKRIYEKGWLEMLMLGDSRTGKDEITGGLMKYYERGEMASGESTSFAGLIGGVAQGIRRSFLKWGRYPLNDRRLFVVNEMTGLDPEIIGNLSTVRDNGLCSIDKIEAGKTLARVRTIWISNPVGDNEKILNMYYGVMQIPKLIKSYEDIARFDFAVILASPEVPSEVINRRRDDVYDNKYPAIPCKLLLDWIWSLKPDQIIFEEDAIDMCYKCGDKIGTFYSDDIPLIKPENSRFKLAKLGAAYAARTFNSVDGKTLIVEARHIIAAYDYLNKVYSRMGMKYDAYSVNQKESAQLTNLSELKDLFDRMEEKNVLRIFCTKMMSSDHDYISSKDISLIIGEGHKIGIQADVVLNVLISSNAIRKASPASMCYRKSLEFIKFIADRNSKFQGNRFEKAKEVLKLERDDIHKKAS